LLITFLADFEKYSALALHNLRSYRWFWATAAQLAGPMNGIRKAVESGLISEAKKSDEPLQSTRCSTSARCRSVVIISRFPSGLEFPGIPERITFGTHE
jgi:hypothetical protein